MPAIRENSETSRQKDLDNQPLVTQSEKLILAHLFRKGPTAQTDLTESLSLSQQSISRLTNSLTERSLLSRTSRKRNGQRGQPSVVIELNDSFAYSAGVSLMADGVTVTIADITGKVIASSSPNLESLTRKRVLRAVSEAITVMLEDHGIEPQRLFGVGVSTSGFRVGPEAEFNTPPSLEEFAFVNLEQLFSESLSLPVWAENDGKAATTAELMTGIGKRSKNFAYLFIATGVGGGVVVDGKLLKSRRGNSGEFVGILPIGEYPFPNLELLRECVSDAGTEFASVSDLVQNLDPDDPGVDRWIKQIKPSLSLIASSTAAILDTDFIVFGGRIPKPLAEKVIPHVEFFDIDRRSVQRDHAKIVPAECRTDPAALGAALLPFINTFFEF